MHPFPHRGVGVTSASVLPLLQARRVHKAQAPDLWAQTGQSCRSTSPAPPLSHFPLCSHTRTPCFLACRLCQHGREAKGAASGPGCLGSNPGCTTDESLSLPGRHIVGLSAEFTDSRCSALCPEHGAHPTDTTCCYFKAGGVVPSYPEPYVLLRLPVAPT